MKKESKRPPGRPTLLGAIETQRFNVNIPPAVAKKLRELGKGSLSLGILEAARYVGVRLT